MSGSTRATLTDITQDWKEYIDYRISNAFPATLIITMNGSPTTSPAATTILRPNLTALMQL